jgi:hypothetical protein
MRDFRSAVQQDQEKFKKEKKKKRKKIEERTSKNERKKTPCHKSKAAPCSTVMDDRGARRRQKEPRKGFSFSFLLFSSLYIALDEPTRTQSATFCTLSCVLLLLHERPPSLSNLLLPPFAF